MPTDMELIERAKDVVIALCAGRQRWTMSVPAEPDRDPDLIIMAALDAGTRALARLAAEFTEHEEGGDASPSSE